MIIWSQDHRRKGYGLASKAREWVPHVVLTEEGAENSSDFISGNPRA